MTATNRTETKWQDDRSLDTEEIVAVSPAMQSAVVIAQRFARADLPILLVGPTGSGKELLARAIHHWSGRSGQLVDINCGALPGELVEGELFGHRRGAFTGAVDDQGGLIAAADRGTLFLDELSSLPAQSQVKLLRVLETGEVRRVGETSKRKVDFRLIAAAQPEFDDRTRNSGLRLDLLHRVCGVVVPLPGLTARRVDIVPLARHFVSRYGRGLSDCAERVLIEYDWPGNVRELRISIDRAVLLTADAELDARVIKESLSLGSGGTRLPISNYGLRPARYTQLSTWIAAGWDASRIATEVGVHRATVFRWLRSYGLSTRPRPLGFPNRPRNPWTGDRVVSKQ